MPRIHLHQSSLLVGLLVAVVMVLISGPGMNRDQQYINGYEPADAVGAFDHGWPLFYLSRKIDYYTRWQHGVLARTPHGFRGILGRVELSLVFH